MQRKQFTKEEIKTLKEARESGMKLSEIADLLGRSTKVVSIKLRALAEEDSKKQCSVFSALHSIPPRVIIRYLYDLGYRIEDNKLVLVQKVEVKLNDIINGKD